MHELLTYSVRTINNSKVPRMHNISPRSALQSVTISTVAESDASESSVILVDLSDKIDAELSEECGEMLSA